MRKYLILFIMITLCGSSMSLFSATKEEAIAYYENKYAEELERYRRTGRFRPQYEEGDIVKPLTYADIEEWGRLEELGLLDKFTTIKLAGFDEVSVLWKDYYYIQDILSKITDEDERWEEEVKIASALSFSRNFGLPFRCALENQEEIAEAWLKVIYQQTPTTEENEEQVAITQEEFNAYIEYLKDNYFELDI